MASTCLLYLVAAGLFSRAVWAFESQKWNIAVGGDAAETGNGAGSYDIDNSVWHVNVSLMFALFFQLLVDSQLTNRRSAALPMALILVDGASSTQFWAGRTRRPTDLSFRTMSTGSLSSFAS